MGTLRTQCKPQQRSLILQELGSSLSRSTSRPCCSGVSFKGGQTKGEAGTPPGAMTGTTGIKQLSSAPPGMDSLRRGIKNSLCSCLVSQCRNCSWKGNLCRALHSSAIPSQPCCCCSGAPSQQFHDLEQPGTVRTWRKSNVRFLNSLDPLQFLGTTAELK